jgi:purine-binding chemotaxis protein CheW
VSNRDKLAETLDALRRSFDSSFAAPPAGEGPDEVALLAIRIGSDPAALRVHETLALLKAGAIVPVPSRRPELLGVTGMRGAVVPVYSLSRLTGRGEGVTPRWIVLAGGAERVGLAFAGFDAHVRVRRDAIHSPAAHRNFEAISGFVEIGDQPRPIIDVPAIVRRITGGSDRGAGGNS